MVPTTATVGFFAARRRMASNNASEPAVVPPGPSIITSTAAALLSPTSLMRSSVRALPEMKPEIDSLATCAWLVGTVRRAASAPMPMSPAMTTAKAMTRQTVSLRRRRARSAKRSASTVIVASVGPGGH